MLLVYTSDEIGIAARCRPARNVNAHLGKPAGVTQAYFDRLHITKLVLLLSSTARREFPLPDGQRCGPLVTQVIALVQKKGNYR